MTTEQRLLDRLARRVGMWHDRHDETGDPRYLRLAIDADRFYRRAKERLV